MGREAGLGLFGFFTEFDLVNHDVLLEMPGCLALDGLRNFLQIDEYSSQLRVFNCYKQISSEKCFGSCSIHSIRNLFRDYIRSQWFTV